MGESHPESDVQFNGISGERESVCVGLSETAFSSTSPDRHIRNKEKEKVMMMRKKKMMLMLMKSIRESKQAKNGWNTAQEMKTSLCSALLKREKPQKREEEERRRDNAR